MNRVCYVHRFGDTFASYRYRCEIPARWLNDNGCPTCINNGEAEIVVFAKPVVEDIEVAREFKKQGGKVVFDITDPHVYEHYEEMFKLADVITCSSEYTRDNLGRESTYIPDPYEYDELAPHATYSNIPSLLWFGHRVNLEDLGYYFNLPEMKVVTGPYLEGESVPDGITFHSQGSLTRALAEANIAFLPMGRGNEYKSPNRLVNSLRMGLFPICGLLPSAKEFREFCWVGHPDTGLRWSHHERKYLNDLVLEGQDFIKKFSPENIGKQWKDLFDSI